MRGEARPGKGTWPSSSLVDPAPCPPFPATSSHPTLSSPSLRLQGGCAQGWLPPGDSGNFFILHFLWERWAEGHWELASRARVRSLQAAHSSRGKDYF